MEKILIVEDEPAINQVLTAYFKKAGYSVKQAFEGDQALAIFKSYHPSLVLLDVMLPGKNGWELLQMFRKLRPCPIIMLTALNQLNHRLQGFEGGADDYIPKPFYGEEVVARVKAVLHRTHMQNEEENNNRYFGKLHIDLDAHRVTVNDTEIVLPPREMALLIFLSAHPNKTFTRDHLLNAVWGVDFIGSDRAVDLSIKRLRKYLSDWHHEDGEIKTIRGLGYQFSVSKPFTS
ncbi:response regulator transcription factor [Bacillus sp. A116_S68]|nr:response regulator transcription factor [Bacillus sp. A116_S68]